MKTKKPTIKEGYRVGMLEVVAPTTERKNGYVVWRCRCDCGGEQLLDTRALQRGNVRDCGCKTKIPPGASDLTGQRYGNLFVVEPTERRDHGSVIWRCLCNCDSVAYVSAHQLLCGYTKSCGCLGHPPLKDFIGQRFGQLEVIGYQGKRSGMHRWRCLCDCGKETVVGQTLLQSGKTKSCGCIQAGIIRENLKLVDGTSVTMLEANKKHLLSNNTSGYTGVYQNKRTGKYIARITFKKKTYFLGAFDRLQDAVAARKRGEELHDEFLENYYQMKT